MEVKQIAALPKQLAVMDIEMSDDVLTITVFVNDIGSQFLIRIGARDFLNVSLLLKFGGHMTTKKGATWLFAHEKGGHL